MIRRIGSSSPLKSAKHHINTTNSNNNMTNSNSNSNGDAQDVDPGHQSRNHTKYNSNTSPSGKTKMSSANTKRTRGTISGYMNSTRLIRLVVLIVLCLQNSMYTILRRYSQGVLKENYSKNELLLVAELIKILYSAWMIQKNLAAFPSSDDGGVDAEGGLSSSIGPQRKSLPQQLKYLASTSHKMLVLALIYGAMNILSFVSLRNISAGMFTIFAQTKILTTATFSTIMLKRQYSWTKWRALIALMMGVLLFSEPIWNSGSSSNSVGGGNPVIGLGAVLIEVSLSGFASIYFEKVIKTDPLQLGIWERNFQLALGSMPVYLIFIIGDGGGTAGFLQGWSPMAALLSALGAAGGLLVALSIKYGDAILKTLATTGAIVLTGVLDHWFLGGPLTPSMVIAGVQVILAICNYTFDASLNTSTTSSIQSSSDPRSATSPSKSTVAIQANHDDQETESLLVSRGNDK